MTYEHIECYSKNLLNRLSQEKKDFPLNQTEMDKALIKRLEEENKKKYWSEEEKNIFKDLLKIHGPNYIKIL